MANSVSFIRLFHAAPLVGLVNVYANDKLIAENLRYKDFTEYLTVPPTLYQIKVVLSRDNSTVILEERINLIQNIIYTAAVTGKDEITVELISDTMKEDNESIAGIRFINLSPDSTMFDIYIDGRLIICGMMYKEVSGYLMLNPGVYSMSVKETSTGKNLLEDPRFTLRGGDYYAAYFVGLTTSKPPLQVLIPLEGVTYL